MVIVGPTIPFISSYINAKIIDELVQIISKKADVGTQLLRLITIYFFVYIIQQMIDTASNYAETRLWYSISKNFGLDVLKKLSELENQHFENPKTNALIIKVNENYNYRPQNFITTTFYLVRPIVTIVSGVSILLVFSPILIGLLLITSIPQFVYNVVFGKRSYGLWDAKSDVKRDYYRLSSKLSHEVSLMEMRIFKARDYLFNRVKGLFEDFQNEQLRIEKRRSLTKMVFDLVSAVGFGLAFLIIALAVVAARITVGQLSFYASTLNGLRNAFDTMFRQAARIYEHGLYVVDIFELLDLENTIKPGIIELKQDSNPPKIEFRNVSFSYPNTSPVIIEDFDLTINPGEHVAIVGENGAGKTTLVKLLARFYDVTSGEILIDGINIKNLSLDSWYSKFGTLFQEFNTYHYDAKTNIGLGNPERLSDFENIVVSSMKSGAHEFIQNYEKKYDQVLDRAFEGGINPSFGQWQKIALARAFFKDAPILILDEPTSAIDPKAEFEIFERLFEFTKGKTVIIISHRFSTVRNASRIIVLDKGKVVEEGGHDELVRIHGGKYKTAFELQRRGYE